MNISHMSVSRHSVIELCEQQYKYKYHLKTESLEPEPFYFIYGKIFHKIAEEYVLNKGERPLPEITKAVLNGEIIIEEQNGQPVYAPTLPNNYRNRMGEHLRNLKNLTDQLGYDGHTEYDFEYDLDPPNHKNLVGFIDRLFQKGDNWYIIDYKTTQRGPYRKNEKTISSDLQLRCYGKVVQRDFGVKAENIRAALYYVEGGNLIGTTFTQASLDAAEEELRQSYLAIEAKNPDVVTGNVGDHCNRCNWRKMCPFFRATKNYEQSNSSYFS